MAGAWRDALADGTIRVQCDVAVRRTPQGQRAAFGTKAA
jgi:hypothetical protein